jgi:hypothetical protein
MILMLAADYVSYFVITFLLILYSIFKASSGLNKIILFLFGFIVILGQIIFAYSLDFITSSDLYSIYEAFIKGNFFTETTMSSRIVRWINILPDIYNNFFLGIGSSNIDLKLDYFIKATHVDNLYLEYLLSFGFFSFFFLLRILYIGIKINKLNNHEIVVYLIFSLLIISGITWTWYYSYGILLFGIFAGLLAKIDTHNYHHLSKNVSK